MALRAAVASLAPLLARAHDSYPLSDLGVPGWPDCVQTAVAAGLGDAAANEATLRCAQRPRDHPAQRAVACVGDSITAGAFSSGGDRPYPQQLDMMLNASHPGQYKVTNLGHCGITAPSYPGTSQYAALMAAEWDIVVVMLGTNDAKQHKGNVGYFPNCTGGYDTKCDPAVTGNDTQEKRWCQGLPDCVGYMQHNASARPVTRCSVCAYDTAMTNLIRDIETAGRGGGAPQIYLMTPPPLFLDGIYEMSKPVINDLLPKIVPGLAAANGAKVIDVYKGMGGVANWRGVFPADPPGCVTGAVNSSYAPCQWFCDKQSCNQCHPNDYGYNHLASVVKAGLGL